MGVTSSALPPVFERSQLQQYVEQNRELEKEIVDLFLLQLPDILAQLRSCSEARDWRLWTHTLKGSAMAVGARRIELAAVELEDKRFQDDSAERRAKVEALDKLAAEFSGLARRLLS